MKTWIGAESIVSPLGVTAEENFSFIKTGQSAISPNLKIKDYDSELCAAIIDYSHENFLSKRTKSKIIGISLAALEDSLSRINTNEIGRTLLILSTTKGDIELLNNDPDNPARPSLLLEKIVSELPFKADTKVLSVACISGLLSAIHAHDLIQAKRYDSVIVTGVDIVSRFTASGFESFFALSDEACKPYDKDRKGLNLGEAASVLILSNNKKLYKEDSMIFSGGASSNDANHISGPSRTGEGLVRAVEKALNYTNVDKKEIDFISSHGTATRFNDDMESIAFDRCDLSKIATSSFKGFYGHTLGAAGVVELAVCLQMMKNNILLKNQGMKEFGCTEDLNVLKENVEGKCDTVLKTASGFGGCNAAAILKKPIS